MLVLSNPSPENKKIDAMVWKVCEVNQYYCCYYAIWNNDKSDWFGFPCDCLAPVFDDEKNLSWKEVTLVIDGKEYTAVMK